MYAHCIDLHIVLSVLVSSVVMFNSLHNICATVSRRVSCNGVHASLNRQRNRTAKNSWSFPMKNINKHNPLFIGGKKTAF